MVKKTNRAIIALIVVIIISVISISALTNPLSPSNSNLNSTLPTINPTNQPTIQPTNQPLLQAYTGYLVSSSYTISQTNGVESTQLVFTNKTFNYAGYISLENNCIYNVTFYDNNPNQALSVTQVDLTIGLMGSAEQVSIVNVAFVPGMAHNASDTMQVMVQNSGGAQASITSAFINGAAVTAANISPALPVPLAEGTTTTITLTVGPADTFTAETTYTIKLITAKGTSIISSATTYNP